ncbi:MAG: cupredoxin domain-containing protein [Nitrososphaeraceae archaeon]
MEKLRFNKKTLISFVMVSILLVGMTYSSQFLVQSTSAKKSSPDKISGTASTSNAVTNNNNNTAIALNALELKNETYRWQNTTQGINPTLHLIAHTDYVIKIKNPTDAKHELIIGSNGTEIAKSNSINPGKNKNFVFNANTTGIFEYHCEYHPDTMKGIIEITNQ